MSLPLYYRDVPMSCVHVCCPGQYGPFCTLYVVYRISPYCVLSVCVCIFLIVFRLRLTNFQYSRSEARHESCFHDSEAAKERTTVLGRTRPRQFGRPTPRSGTELGYRRSRGKVMKVPGSELSAGQRRCKRWGPLNTKLGT